MKNGFKADNKKPKKYLSKNNGFTLVELIIAIAIIAILSAAAVPRALQYVEKAKMTSDAQAANAYESAFEMLIAAGDIRIVSGSALNVSEDTSLYITNADEAPPVSPGSLDIFNQYEDKISVSNKLGTISLDIYFSNIGAIKNSKGYDITPEELGNLFQENVKLSDLKYYHGIVIDFENRGVSGNILIER